MIMTKTTIRVRMLLMEPSAPKHLIAAGISLDEALSADGILSAYVKL